MQPLRSDGAVAAGLLGLVEPGVGGLDEGEVVLGVDRGLTLIGTLPDYESIVIDAAGRVYYSDGLTPPDAETDE